MGLGDLRLVAPRAGASGRAAAAMAVHAGDVLRNAQRYDSLGAALADCTLAVGTTCRPGLYRSGVVALREAAMQLAVEAAANRVAIIFGPEDTGLVKLELKLFQRLLAIPTATEASFLHMAPAVLLFA